MSIPDRNEGRHTGEQQDIHVSREIEALGKILGKYVPEVDALIGKHESGEAISFDATMTESFSRETISELFGTGDLKKRFDAMKNARTTPQVFGDRTYNQIAELTTIQNGWVRTEKRITNVFFPEITSDYRVSLTQVSGNEAEKQKFEVIYNHHLQSDTNPEQYSLFQITNVKNGEVAQLTFREEGRYGIVLLKQNSDGKTYQSRIIQLQDDHEGLSRLEIEYYTKDRWGKPLDKKKFTIRRPEKSL
jgi:hypothetical protein